MTDVSLRKITAANWQACTQLKVRDEQVDLVPSNLYSIAEAQFYQAVALAVYDDDEDIMVGFVLYGVDVHTGKYKVFRLMVDQAHQGKGYGRAAMRKVIRRLAAQADCDEVLICYKPANHAAQKLYASLGFVEQEVNDDQVLASLELTKQP